MGQACQDCLADPVQMANRFDEVFASLRRNVRKAEKDGTLESAIGKPQVWYFLLDVVSRSNFLKNQVIEVGHMLEKSMPWAQVLNSDAELRSRKEAVLKF